MDAAWIEGMLVGLVFGWLIGATMVFAIVDAQRRRTTPDEDPEDPTPWRQHL